MSSIVSIMLGLSSYRPYYCRRAAGAKGGRVSHARLREKSDAAILGVLRFGGLRATEIAEKTGYTGWRGIRKKLNNMLDRDLLRRDGRIYYIQD